MHKVGDGEGGRGC